MKILGQNRDIINLTPHTPMKLKVFYFDIIMVKERNEKIALFCYFFFFWCFDFDGSVSDWNRRGYDTFIHTKQYIQDKKVQKSIQTQIRYIICKQIFSKNGYNWCK